MDKKSSEVEAVNKATNPLQMDKSYYKEIKKLRKSFQEMNETMKKLHETLLTKASLPNLSLKEEEKETPKKEVEEATHECCFESEDADGTDTNTIFVKGFDSSLPRDDIKTALTKHFGSCGEITRVFVPIECKTGAPLGFAFINMNSGEDNAFRLGGSYLGGRELEVDHAMSRPEYALFPNFRGCKRCRPAQYKALMKRRSGSCGDRVIFSSDWKRLMARIKAANNS